MYKYMYTIIHFLNPFSRPHLNENRPNFATTAIVTTVLVYVEADVCLGHTC